MIMRNVFLYDVSTLKKYNKHKYNIIKLLYIFTELKVNSEDAKYQNKSEINYC